MIWVVRPAQWHLGFQIFAGFKGEYFRDQRSAFPFATLAGSIAGSDVMQRRR